MVWSMFAKRLNGCVYKHLTVYFCNVKDIFYLCLFSSHPTETFFFQ